MRMNEVRTLLTGRGLVESPRWHGDRLYFSDWSAGEVIAVDLAGHSEVIAHVDSLPLCTAWLPDGRLVIVSSSDGRLLRREPDGSLVTHADLGKPGWNDIVVDGRGNAYVNRGGFNPMAGEAFKPGFVALVTADGSVRQVADDIAFPNAMAVTPTTQP
jgi:sugar lactone lactonase YvrE